MAQRLGRGFAEFFHRAVHIGQGFTDRNQLAASAWRFLVGSAVRLRSVGDGIVSAFSASGAMGSTVAPNFCTGAFPSQEHTATRKLASAQPVWSRRYAPPPLRSGHPGDPPDQLRLRRLIGP